MAEPIPPRAQSLLPQPSPLIGAPILAPPGSEDYLHELRVRIPVDLHRQLLSLKVLRGKSLAETVSIALDIYFVEHQKQAAEARAEGRAER